MLRVKNLSVVTSGGRSILKECSWQVEQGKRLGIIGESGSGKSITALAIMGLLPDGMLASGSVTLSGQEILNLPESSLQKVRGGRIGMVFQEPLTALDPLMKVEQQIMGPIRLHNELSRTAARARARELLERVAIRDTERVASSYPWQLSGGQRQRVALAMVLACDPDVIIADEPTTALDVTVQAGVLDLLNRLVAETGTTLVFISHDLPVIAQVASELVVMKDGQIVEETSVERGLKDPDNAYTRKLVAAAEEVSYLPRLDPEGAGHAKR